VGYRLYIANMSACIAMAADHINMSTVGVLLTKSYLNSTQ